MHKIDINIFCTDAEIKRNNEMKKYSEIKTKQELKNRVKDGVLSVGCYWSKIRHLVSESSFPGAKKIKIIYSPGYGGTAEITRYI